MKTAAPLLLFLCLSPQLVFTQSSTGTPPEIFPGLTGTPATGSSSPAAGTPAAPGSAAVPGSTAAAGAPAAPNPAIPDLSVPVDTAKQWTVGFSVFGAENLLKENAYLAYSLPLLLKNEVSGLDAHAFSPEERDMARSAIISREKASAEQTITKIRKERDSLAFGAVPPSPSTLQGVEARLAAVVVRREFLQILDEARVDVAAEKPVNFKEGSGVGKLLDLPGVSAAAYCASQALDLLVGGTLREVQGYLLLEIWAFDATRGKIVLSSREAAEREKIYAFMPDVGKELAGIILGREWTELAFNPDPPGASLYVDDALVASGVSPALYLSPGTRAIRVSALGYRDETRTVTLEPGQQYPLDVKLEKEVTGSVSVTSDPTGADLYVDSIWKGKTPLLVERPPSRSRGVLSLTGFYDLPFSIGQDSMEQLSFSLQKDVGPRDVLQKKARNDFYVSFGWFAVSIAVPLFTYALAIDSRLHEFEFAAVGNNSQAASAHLNYQLYLGGYYAGMAVSAALFTWMVFRIVHYVAVSNGTAG
jgi:hypothetical protein